MIGNIPQPCPVLQEGLALGAPEHVGFVTVWNWIVDLFRKPKENFVTRVDGRTGDINIVAGEGIDVIANGNTITVGLGAGKSIDKGNPDNVDPNGGGSEDNPGIWQNAEPSETSGGSGGGGSGGMFAWNAEDKSIGVGGCMIGRRWVTATNTGSNKADGLYQLQCTLPSGGTGSCAVVSNVSLGQAPTATQCWIPIYQITDGKIAADYRGAFVVPCYE